MLGDKIGDRRGKVTGQRVLPSEGQGPTVERSFQQGGPLLGVETAEVGTYWAVVRPDGTLYGEGQGVLMGQHGEMGAWIGQGAGPSKAVGR